MIRSLLIFLLLSAPLLAQEPYWVPLDGPKSGPVGHLARHPDGRLFVGGTTTLGWTSDLGTTWHLHPIPGGGTLYDITISPDGNLYVCTHLGLYKSTTDGATFERLHNGDARQLHIGHDGTLLNYTRHELIRSRDDGVTWDTLQANWYNNRTVQFSANGYGEVLLLHHDRGAYFSDDWGDTWDLVLDDVRLDATVYHQLQDAYYIITDHSYSDNKFRVTLWHTTNDGVSWDSTICYTFNYEGSLYDVGRQGIVLSISSNAQYLVLDNHGATYDALHVSSWRLGDILWEGDTITIGYGHGVAYSTDRGTSWTDIGSGIQLSSVYELVAAENNNIFAEDFTIFRSPNGGATWEEIHRTGFTLGGVVTDQWGRFYIATDYLLRLNPYDSKIDTVFGNGFWFGIAITAEGYIAAASGTYCIGSVNNGGTWNQIGFFSGRGDPIVPFPVGTTEKNELYVWPHGGSLRWTSDFGQTWTVAESPSIWAPRDLVFDSNGNMYVLHTYTKKLYGSSNRGETWEVLYDIDEYISSLIILKDDDLVLSHEDRILRSSDQGASWYDITGNLPDAAYLSLAVDDGGYLYAGVEDRGVYKTAVPVSVGSTPEAAGEFSLEIHPNPVSADMQSINLHVAGVEGSTFSVSIHDALGRTLLNKQYDSMTRDISIPVAGYLPGVYYVRLTSNGMRQTKKLLVR